MCCTSLKLFHQLKSKSVVTVVLHMVCATAPNMLSKCLFTLGFKVELALISPYFSNSSLKLGQSLERTSSPPPLQLQTSNPKTVLVRLSHQTRDSPTRKCSAWQMHYIAQCSFANLPHKTWHTFRAMWISRLNMKFLEYLPNS